MAHQLQNFDSALKETLLIALLDNHSNVFYVTLRALFAIVILLILYCLHKCFSCCFFFISQIFSGFRIICCPPRHHCQPGWTPPTQEYPDSEDVRLSFLPVHSHTENLPPDEWIPGHVSKIPPISSGIQMQLMSRKPSFIDVKITN